MINAVVGTAFALALFVWLYLVKRRLQRWEQGVGK